MPIHGGTKTPRSATSQSRIPKFVVVPAMGPAPTQQCQLYYKSRYTALQYQTLRGIQRRSKVKSEMVKKEFRQHQREEIYRSHDKKI